MTSSDHQPLVQRPKVQLKAAPGSSVANVDGWPVFTSLLIARMTSWSLCTSTDHRRLLIWSIKRINLRLIYNTNTHPLNIF